MDSNISHNPEAFAGERVVLTGRLASMTRTEAVRVLMESGARICSSVSRHTTLLIVGECSWPLSSKGRLSRKLQTARWLQRRGQELRIIAEQEFLERADCCSERDAICRTYSTVDLVRMLGIPRERLWQWVDAGLVQPVEKRRSVPYFDFREVCRARSLVALVQNGIPERQIRRSLVQMRRWIPSASDVLGALARLEPSGGNLVFELSDGRLIEAGGQLVMRFAEESEGCLETLSFARKRTADDLFEQAVSCEEQEEWSAAIALYKRLLALEGPDPEVCFNLGNVLYASGQRDAAIERYQQSVELDPAYAEAWYNLGNVLIDLQRNREAVMALERAVAAAPGYADARSTLADLLDEVGETDAAQFQWEAYLELDDTGDWAEHARRRLTRNRA